MHATVRTLLSAAAATVALVVAGLAAPAARADTVWVASGGGKPLAYEKVKVIGIKGDQFTFRSASGRETSKDLDSIHRVSLDDDPAFTAAEAAFETRDWDRAVAEYDKVVKASNVDWVKDRSTIRLIKAAGESGKFTAAAAGFLALLEKDAENATKYKPTVPEGKVDQIDPVIADVKRALGESPDADRKQALMTFLMELQRGKGDTAAASATAEELLKLGGDDASPELARVQAAAKLQFARVNIDQKKYKEALKQIDENAQYFTEPSAQVDALLCRGDALA